jgi:hypothetical protein
VIRGSRYLTGIHQFWDATFHANAVRFIADTGNSSPTALKAINVPAWAGFFYPNAYHNFIALVFDVTGYDIHIALNTASAFTVGLFALSLVGLVRATGGRAGLAAASALLACACAAFPYDILTWGPLLPYVVAVALVPSLLALLVTSLAGRRGGAVLLGVASVGLLAIHPGAAVAAGLLGVVYIAHCWIAARRVQLADVRVLLTAGAVAAVLGIAQVRGAAGMNVTLDVDWPAQFHPSDSIGQLLTMGHARPFPQWWVVGLAVVGVAGLRNLRALRWYLAGSAVFGALFVLAASYEGPWVALLTRPWWNDSWRLVALFVPAMVLLAAAGAVRLGEGALGLARRLPGLASVLRPTRAAVGCAIAAVLALVTVASDGLYYRSNEARIAESFAEGPTVTPADREAFRVLARIVPDDALVMNDPQDGSPWMWALEDVRPVFGHALGPAESFGIGPERDTLLQRFNTIDSDGEVRRAAEHLNVRYLFISKGFTAPNNVRARGLQDLDRVTSLRMVFSNAESTIYEVCVVTGCQSPDIALAGLISSGNG